MHNELLKKELQFGLSPFCIGFMHTVLNRYIGFVHHTYTYKTCELFWNPSRMTRYDWDGQVVDISM
jgi:hypothetical protein